MSYYKKQEQEGNNRLHGVVEPQQSVVTTTAFPLRAKKNISGKPSPEFIWSSCVSPDEWLILVAEQGASILGPVHQHIQFGTDFNN